MRRRFGYLPIVSGLVREEQLNQLMANYAPAFERLGGIRWQVEQLESPLPLFFFVGTGGTEQIILDLQAKRSETIVDEPVFLLAHSGNNSLPAALEVLARLQQEGQKGRIFYLKHSEDAFGLQQIERAVRNAEVHHALRQVRIGLIGKPSDWLVASSPTEETVQTAWGPKIIPIDLKTLIDEIQALSRETVQPHLESLIADAVDVQEPSEAELYDTVKVYHAMKRLIEHHQLDAVTLRCFDLIKGLKTTGCFALAQLIDEGIIAGCEGDLVSTIGMLWAYTLLDEIPWMANPSQIDEARNTLWLGHCTVPRRMVKSYRLRSHFESEMGMGLQGELPIGPITLLRIGGKTMEQLWLAEGEILQTGDAENLCRTQVEIQLNEASSVADLLNAPLGNHLVMVFGHHADTLRNYWETMVQN